MQVKPFKKRRVHVVTLGCSKNWVDSENLLTQLSANDFEVFHDGKLSQPEVVIVNTCGFIDRAKEESVQTILEMAKLKTKGKVKKLYVMGCLSERYSTDLEKEIPEVDRFFGSHHLPEIIEELDGVYKYELLGERKIFTPTHYAYLKISEGCNRTCSFCAIPLMRGSHQSRTIEDLVQEANNLAAQGVKELILIAQELTYYGLDLYRKRSLPSLLERLSEVEGIQWIRLHYAYPSKFPMEVIEAMAKLPKVLNYLDLPLQHIDDEILTSMRRQINQTETTQLITDIRSIIPDITLRTTFLLGFPGEKESHFQNLCDFVEKTRFDRVGVFSYSHEEQTLAYQLDDDVPAEEKSRRMNILMDLQSEISFDKNLTKIGMTLPVLFDRIDQDHFVGRTEADSPEVDNEVLVSVKNNYVRLGDITPVLIKNADAYDLFGDVITATD